MYPSNQIVAPNAVQEVKDNQKEFPFMNGKLMTKLLEYFYAIGRVSITEYSDFKTENCETVWYPHYTKEYSTRYREDGEGYEYEKDIMVNKDITNFLQGIFNIFTKKEYQANNSGLAFKVTAIETIDDYSFRFSYNAAIEKKYVHITHVKNSDIDNRVPYFYNYGGDETFVCHVQITPFVLKGEDYYLNDRFDHPSCAFDFLPTRLTEISEQ
jgi:hypothetical protein